MPLNHNLNTKFAAAEETIITNSLTALGAAITTTVPDTVNLSDEERKSTRTISDIRAPYAHRAVTDFGPAYPHLNSVDVPLLKAENNQEFFKQLLDFESGLKELLDRVVDLKINAGYLVMKFTDDQYRNARDYRTRNVTGADTIYDAQFPLYDREANPGAGGEGGGGTP